MDEHQRQLKVKFSGADANGDGNLNLEEFGTFVHPQRHEHMVDHLVTDQLMAYDKDQDGEISRREYLGNPQASSAHTMWLGHTVRINDYL